MSMFPDFNIPSQLKVTVTGISLPAYLLIFLPWVQCWMYSHWYFGEVYWDADGSSPKGDPAIMGKITDSKCLLKHWQNKMPASPRTNCQPGNLACEPEASLTRHSWPLWSAAECLRSRDILKITSRKAKISNFSSNFFLWKGKNSLEK